MTDKKRNLIVSFLFMAFGVFLLVESMGIKHMMKNDVGSGFFPKIIAIVMIAVSVIRLIMTLLEPSGETNTSDSDMVRMSASLSFCHVEEDLVNPLLINVYYYIRSVGFIIDTVIYLFIQMLILTPKEKRNMLMIGIISIIAPICIYTLFTYVINTPLPKGIFGF